MKVLVLNTNRERSPHTLIPLGACCVASAARAAGHDVRLIDLGFARLPEAEAAGSIRQFRPDVVGLSVRNIDNCDGTSPVFYLPEAKEIVRACREAGAGTIVLGGTAVTAVPGPVLRYLEGDFAVIGEGEAAFPALLEAMESGGDPASVPGVAALQDGSVKVSPPEPVTDLSSLPDACPGDWLDIPRFRRYDAAMPVQTKRGCPFRCSYCLYPAIEGSELRLRAPELAASDVHRAARLGFRTAEFVDSVFNVPESHAVSCCESIARLDDRVPVQTLEFNPSTCSSELVDAMRAAGFAAVGCSAESGSDAVLAALGKGYTSNELRRTADGLRRLDIQRLWLFMLCGPGETEHTVAETAHFIERCLTPRDLVYITLGVRVLPGTELHARAVSDGLVPPDDDLLEPRFYFSPHVSADRAMSIILDSGFPTANVVTASDGNHRLLPAAQRLAHLLCVSPPYWRWAPLWNRTRLLRPWARFSKSPYRAVERRWRK